MGLERGRDVMREAVAEKSLGERAMTREVNIVRRTDVATSGGVSLVFVKEWTCAAFHEDCLRKDEGWYV